MERTQERGPVRGFHLWSVPHAPRRWPGHASHSLWADGEVCVWHDEILPREQAVFVSCFRHTVGILPGYEIDVVVSGYRTREDFEHVKLREVHVRVP